MYIFPELIVVEKNYISQNYRKARTGERMFLDKNDSVLEAKIEKAKIKVVIKLH